jgi:hypothetical protein
MTGVLHRRDVAIAAALTGCNWLKSDRCAARTIDLFIEEEVDMETLNSFSARRVPWNKGRCQSKIEMSYRRLSTDVVFLVGCESCLQRFEFT